MDDDFEADEDAVDTELMIPPTNPPPASAERSLGASEIVTDPAPPYADDDPALRATASVRDTAADQISGRLSSRRRPLSTAGSDRSLERDVAASRALAAGLAAQRRSPAARLVRALFVAVGGLLIGLALAAVWTRFFG